MVITEILKAPTLLIATPQLRDRRFARSVILLCEHSDKATMGLVLNHPGETRVSDFLMGLDMHPNETPSGRVNLGGPVQQDRAFVLHDSAHRGPETQVLLESVCLSFSLESLKLFVEDLPEAWRIYTGYAGWGEGQLAREVAEGSWLMATAKSQWVFETAPEKLYDAILGSLAIDPARFRTGSGMN